MFTPQAIGFVDSAYKDTAAIPKGLGAKHDAEGILRILPEFEVGLTDIEGFSHLMVIWAFDRSHGFDLLGTPPFDNRHHGVFATRSPRRPNRGNARRSTLRAGLRLRAWPVVMISTPISTCAMSGLPLCGAGCDRRMREAAAVCASADRRSSRSGGRSGIRRRVCWPVSG
jgi:hypothetical protein